MKKRRVKYLRANLCEARNTAAQFILSISKNECNLKDANTQSIFHLLLVIFFE
jgi:hypothetical protein